MDVAVTITETSILNRMHGSESVMLYSDEITGVAYIVVHALHRSTTRDTQKRTLGRNRSTGLFPSANLVMNPNIVELKKMHIMTFSGASVPFVRTRPIIKLSSST